MSTTIDQKVVEMRFDNQQFERGVATTMDSIKKLEKSLDLSGASKGLENVEAAARNCNMSGLSSAVETVQMKFSALEVMGITALTNITNSAVNAGKRIVSALTIDPVKTGFSEYELKMGSIQTMMAATGESLETVNGYLNDLNEYSDKTIYSFSDMTQNIGKFTNAGVNLEDSVAAIKGIANVAAVSGANSNEASRAMYNFAQALSSGYVKLIDWKSIELANMGTVEFKNQLLEAAAAAGTLTKTGDGMYKTMDGKVVSATKNFNDSLQDQWMTSEVLIGTLKKYTDETTDIGKKATQAATEVKTLSQLYDTLKESAQSGWAQTWEIIVGDFEEAKKFMTELSEIFGTLIGKQAESRNELLENWKVLGGRTALLDSIRNIFEGIASIVKPISAAFREIFPPMTAERLMGFTEGLKNLTARLKISDDTSDKLKRTFKGLFAIVDIVRQVFVAVMNVVGKLLTPTGKLGSGILSITAGIGDFLVAVRDFIARSNILNGAFSLLGNIIGFIVRMIGDATTFIGDAFSSGPIASIVNFLNRLKVDVTETFDEIGATIEGSTFFTVLGAIGNVIKTIAKVVTNVLGKAFENTFGSFEEGGFMNFIDALISGGIGVAIIKLISSIGNVFKSMDGIVESISEIFDGLTDTFKAFQNALNATALKTIATAILTLVIALFALTLIDKQKLSDALAVLTVLFTELMIGVSIMNGFNAHRVGTTMTGIAMALLLMVIPLKILSGMDSEDMARGLVGLTLLLTVLMSTLAILSKIKTNGVLRHTSMLTSIAFALLLMCAPLAIVGTMEWITIGRGLSGMAGMLAVVMGALAILSKIKTNGVLKHISLLSSISFALLLMCAPLAIVGNMEWLTIGRGLSGMIGVLTVMSAALFALSKIKTNGVLKHVGLLYAITMALNVMIVPLSILGNMKWATMGRGLVGIISLLGLMTTALVILSKIKVSGVLKNVSSLVAITGALMLMTIPLIALGFMPWDKMWQGIAGIGTVLGGLVAALALITLISKMSAGGAAGAAGTIAAMAGAILVLVPSLIALSLVPILSLVKSIVAIAAAFTVLGVAGAVLQPLVPAIASLATALLMIGVSFLAAGIGVTMFGIGLGILATTILAFGSACVALIGMIDTVAVVIAKLVAGLVLGLITGLGEGIVAIIGILTDAIPALSEFVKTLIVELCDIIITCAPKIVDTVLELLALVLESLVTFMPRIVKSLGEVLLILLDGLIELAGPLVEKIVGLLVAIMEGIANSIEPLVAAALNVLAALLNGVIKGIADLDTDGLLQALTNVGMLAAIVAALAAIAVLTPAAMVGVLGLGAVVTELSIVLAALGAISKIPGLQWLIKEGGNFLQTIGTAIGQFVGGIIGGIGTGITAQLPAMAENLSEFMELITPFIEGAKLIDSSSLSGIQNLVKMVLMITAANVIDGLTSWLTGGSSMGQFADEIALLGHGLKSFSDTVSGISVESVAAGTEAALKLAEMANVIPNQGGVISWFSGDNGVAAFALQLPILGAGLLGFSNAVAGIVPENVIAAANAAKALADMASTIPNQGGIISWFSGDNGVAAFALQLPILGYGLLAFSNSVAGIVPENVMGAANAAKALADMAATIPDTGGVAAWFAGDNSIANFAGDLVNLGRGIKGFADVTTGISVESVQAAANAAKTLADMAATIPNKDGVVAWFTGENSIAAFASELPKLGNGLKGFADSVTGIVPENITAAANAAKALAEMTATIPKSEGIKAWFTGETNIADFAGKLPSLGEGLKGFSDSVAGIVPENVTAAANAAKALGDMTSVIPKDTKKIVTFGENLTKFGGNLKSYFDATSAITEETVSATNNMVAAVKDVANINASGAKSASEAITKLTKAIKGTEGITGKSTSGFVEALKNLASVSADAFIKSFEDITKKMKEVGKEAIEAFVKGVTDNTKTAKTAGGDLAEAVADAAGESVGSFETAGKDLVEGFANGISKNAYLAEAKARAMAAAAAKAAKEELDEHSPSKVGYEIGDFFGIAFVNAIGDNIGAAYDASSEMASSAKSGLGDAIARIADFINSDMDAEPTIRPVLDLSNVKSGMHTLGRMMNIGSDVGVLANVGAIHAGMSLRGQNGDVNGTTNNSNVTNNTYIIDGVTYDDGSNVANAMEEIVHAAKVERRT